LQAAAAQRRRRGRVGGRAQRRGATPRNALKAPVPDDIDDDGEFLALRFSGKKPMVGFRSSRIFHVVWFDSKFSLYEH